MKSIKSSDIEDELDKITIERIEVKESCDKVHAQFDVYHPDGHQTSYIKVRKSDLKALIETTVAEAQENAVKEFVLWLDNHHHDAPIGSPSTYVYTQMLAFLSQTKPEGANQ